MQEQRASSKPIAINNDTITGHLGKTIDILRLCKKVRGLLTKITKRARATMKVAHTQIADAIIKLIEDWRKMV
jgi:hypothetical protein